jgi:hypothetical protein
MWTNINQVYATKDSQNGWAHIAADNKWHRILPGAADGVTNHHRQRLRRSRHDGEWSLRARFTEQ